MGPKAARSFLQDDWGDLGCREPLCRDPNTELLLGKGGVPTHGSAAVGRRRSTSAAWSDRFPSIAVPRCRESSRHAQPVLFTCNCHDTLLWASLPGMALMCLFCEPVSPQAPLLPNLIVMFRKVMKCESGESVTRTGCL